MHRMTKLVRAVLIPVAALTILVASAVPASAATLSVKTPVKTAPVAKTLSMNW
jgi:hypothetical protein